MSIALIVATVKINVEVPQKVRIKPPIIQPYNFQACPQRVLFSTTGVAVHPCSVLLPSIITRKWKQLR